MKQIIPRGPPAIKEVGASGALAVSAGGSSVWMFSQGVSMVDSAFSASSAIANRSSKSSLDILCNIIIVS